MCDYSLHAAQQRKARKGDLLVSKKFSYGTIGMCAPAHPDVAVCMLPGTEVAFRAPVVDQRSDRLSEFCLKMARKLGFKKLPTSLTAKFVRVDTDRDDRHHDALEFPGGKIVMVTHLVPGQKLDVLQLPAKASGLETGGSAQKAPQQLEHA